MAEEDDKPGVGVSGVAVGAGAGLVGAGVVAGGAHLRKRGMLTDEAKKHIDEGVSQKASDAAKAEFDKTNPAASADAFQTTIKEEITRAEEAAVAEAAKTDGAIAALNAKKSAAEILEAGKQSEMAAASTKATKEFGEKFKDAKTFDVKAYAETHKAADAGLADTISKMNPEEAHAHGLKAAGEKASVDAKALFEKTHTKAEDYVKVAEGKVAAAKKAGVEAAGKAETKLAPAIAKQASGSASAADVLKAGAEGHGAHAAREAEKGLVGKILKEDVAKKIGEDAGKVTGAAATAGADAVKAAEQATLASTKAVKEANFIKKPFVAFGNMSGKGKALAIGVGAVLAIGGAMWMKARRQNAWQDRIDSERAAAAQVTAQAPAAAR